MPRQPKFQPAREAVVDLGEYKIWYCTAGWNTVSDPSLRAVPVVILHGGPGYASNYMWPCQDMLTRLKIPSVVFDQVGSGRSSRLPEHHKTPNFWTVDFFVNQVTRLVNHLQLRHYDIWGHGWGSMLALEFALTKPEGLDRMVLQSPRASNELFYKETRRLRSLLPTKVQQTLIRGEALGQCTGNAWAEAQRSYFRRHVCRDPSISKPYMDTLDPANLEYSVQTTIVGTSHFYCTTSLKDWSVKDRLDSLGFMRPPLFIRGEHDQCTNAVLQELIDAWPGDLSKLRFTIGKASHLAHLEQPLAVEVIVAAYLRAERSLASVPSTPNASIASSHKDGQALDGTNGDGPNCMNGQTSTGCEETPGVSEEHAVLRDDTAHLDSSGTLSASEQCSGANEGDSGHGSSQCRPECGEEMLHVEEFEDADAEIEYLRQQCDIDRSDAVIRKIAMHVINTANLCVWMLEDAEKAQRRGHN